MARQNRYAQGYMWLLFLHVLVTDTASAVAYVKQQCAKLHNAPKESLQEKHKI